MKLTIAIGPVARSLLVVDDADVRAAYELTIDGARLTTSPEQWLRIASWFASMHEPGWDLSRAQTTAARRAETKIRTHLRVRGWRWR